MTWFCSPIQKGKSGLACLIFLSFDGDLSRCFKRLYTIFQDLLQVQSPMRWFQQIDGLAMLIAAIHSKSVILFLSQFQSKCLSLFHPFHLIHACFKKSIDSSFIPLLLLFHFHHRCCCYHHHLLSNFSLHRLPHLQVYQQYCSYFDKHAQRK